MDASNTWIWLLAIATLVVALAIGMWQRRKASKAKVDHEHSAMTSGRPDQRKTDGAPGVKPR
jgi:FtsZ-interacting cell division protein ZipA